MPVSSKKDFHRGHWGWNPSEFKKFTRTRTPGWNYWKTKAVQIKLKSNQQNRRFWGWNLPRNLWLELTILTIGFSRLCPEDMGILKNYCKLTLMSLWKFQIFGLKKALALSYFCLWLSGFLLHGFHVLVHGGVVLSSGAAGEDPFVAMNSLRHHEELGILWHWSWSSSSSLGKI